MSEDYTFIVCPSCFAKNRVPTDKLSAKPFCGKCKATLQNDVPAVLNNDTFSKYISANDQLVIVDFWASWCQPCHTMAPQFANAAKQMPQVRFAKIQTDKFEKPSQIYAIRSLPTLVAFKNGKAINRVSGAMPMGDIVRWVKSIV